MPRKVRWGVLGVASIAIRRAVPGMQKGQWSEITAIASRDKNKAEEAARKLGIPKFFGSYAELLADKEIDAVYNPLPHHLHVPWSIQAAEAGKHVLCEKPISTTVADAQELLRVRDRTGVKIGEAFMVRTHPRWLRTRELIRSGRIGKLRLISGVFSYFNNDFANIRNIQSFGGGALLDMGCYPITLSRFIFHDEPKRVFGMIERDPETEVDRLTSAILDFPSGQSTFTCGTQIVHFQRMQFLGTGGRIEIQFPINAPRVQPSQILIDDGKAAPDSIATETFEYCDQFTMQGDLFSKAILENGEVPVPLEDSVRNMAVIEAVFRSGKSGRWEQPSDFLTS